MAKKKSAAKINRNLKAALARQNQAQQDRVLLMRAQTDRIQSMADDNRRLAEEAAQLQRRLDANIREIDALKRDKDDLVKRLEDDEKKIVRRETKREVREELEERFPYLGKALDDLVDGEIIYRTCKAADACYAAIYLCYVKAIERMLVDYVGRIEPGRLGRTGTAMLSEAYQIILDCDELNPDLKLIRTLNSRRSCAAHYSIGNPIKKREVEELREQIFTNGLLERIYNRARR